MFFLRQRSLIRRVLYYKIETTPSKMKGIADNFTTLVRESYTNYVTQIFIDLDPPLVPFKITHRNIFGYPHLYPSLNYPFPQRER